MDAIKFRTNKPMWVIFCENIDSFGSSDTYKIRGGLHLDCNSENVTCIITCKKCKNQYVGSCIIRFCTRFSN